MASIVSKSEKYVLRRENYRPIFFMIIDTRILNKISAGEIQQYVEKEIYPSKFGLFQECKFGLTRKNFYFNAIHRISRAYEKKPMIIFQ